MLGSFLHYSSCLFKACSSGCTQLLIISLGAIGQPRQDDISFVTVCLCRHYVYVTHTENIKSFDFNRRTGEIYWTSPALGMIGRQAKTDRDSLKRPNATVWLTGIDRLAFQSLALLYFFCFQTSNIQSWFHASRRSSVFLGTCPSLFCSIPLGHWPSSPFSPFSGSAFYKHPFSSNRKMFFLFGSQTLLCHKHFCVANTCVFTVCMVFIRGGPRNTWFTIAEAYYVEKNSAYALNCCCLSRATK